jgi:hypothetical protein
MNKTEYVIGTVHGYSPEELKPFLHSLKRTGYRGQVILYVSNMKEGTVEWLHGQGVRTIPFRDIRCVGPRLLRRLIGGAVRLLGFIPGLMHTDLGRSLLDPNTKRFLFYRPLLEEIPDDASVLLTDVRDVIFQGHPFSMGVSGDLMGFQESSSMPLGSGRDTTRWIKVQFGKEVLERLRNRPLICAGTIMGTGAGIRRYLEVFDDFYRSAFHPEMFGGDQSALNVLCYEHADRFKGIRFQLVSNEEGPVYTTNRFIPENKIRITEEGWIAFEDGRIAPIIHQYDRHPRVQAALFDCLEKAGLAGRPG